MVLSMILTGLSLVVTVVVLNLYHHNPDVPVPAWLLAFTECYKRPLCTITKGRVGDPEVRLQFFKFKRKI